MAVYTDSLTRSFYALLARTKVGAIPRKVVAVKDGTQMSEPGVPRFENFRGAEGDVVYDLRGYKGVVGYDENVVTVKAATTWGEVYKRFPDVMAFSVLEDFAVGGSLYFGDPFFGLNEFRMLKLAVQEVRYFKDGQVRVGLPEPGSIPLEVTLKRNKAELVWKRFETNNVDEILVYLRQLAARGLVPFRHFEVRKLGPDFEAIAVYTKLREGLVKPILDLFGVWVQTSPEGPVSLKSLNWPLYMYFGVIEGNDIFSLKPVLSDPGVKAVVVLERSRYWVSLFSNRPLGNISGLTLLPFSDAPDTEAVTSGCVLCGKCVEVCPHAELKGSFVYSPLGFFADQSFTDVSEIATCDFCGICEAVCPVKLPILDSFSVKARFVTEARALQEEGQVTDKVLLITGDVKDAMKDEISYAVVYLTNKGEDVSTYVVPVSLTDLVRTRDLPPEIRQKLQRADKIYVILPEMYRALSSVFDVSKLVFLEEVALAELESKGAKHRVHWPCYLREGKGDCSHAFYDYATNSKTDVRLGYDVTLCPLTSAKLGIPTPLAILGKVSTDSSRLLALDSEIKARYADAITDTLKEDLDWYVGLSDEAVHEIKLEAMLMAVKGVPKEDIEKLKNFVQVTDSSSETTKLLHNTLRMLF
ncbi:MAG: NADH-quinone oxidoreductase subunit I [Thermoprotei archaeon]